jgi:hypothetical protein
LVFEKQRQLFRRKLSKIAENCDHNTDPWDRFYKTPLWPKMFWIIFQPQIPDTCPPIWQQT